MTTRYSAEGGFWLATSSSVSLSQLRRGSKASWNFPQCNRASCNWAIRSATWGWGGGEDDGHPRTETKTSEMDCYDSHPFVEGVPLEVGALQVVFQRLRVCVFGGTLNQALTDGVDMLQLGLNAVHLLSLHSLKTRGGLINTSCFFIIFST